MTPTFDGFIRPANTQFREFLDMADSLSLPELKASFQKLKANNTSEVHWMNYFQGLMKIKENQDINALLELQKVYESVKHRFIDIEIEQYRLAGLALKKIGWIYRNNKDFEKAYYYHNARYQYMKQYGSALEIHDSAISLDVDSYHLKDLKLSELWLQISREAAEEIKNPIDRARSLGISDNNLSGTYSSQKRFEEAVSYIFKSLDHWIEYESLTGPHEFKVVWAYYGVGYIFETWAQHLKELRQNFQNPKDEAEKAYSKALELGEKRQMPENDVVTIREHLNQIQNLAQES